MDKSRLKSTPGGSDRMRLLMLGGLLVVVVAVFVYTRTRPALETEVSQPSFEPARYPENAPPAAQVDRVLLADVADASPAERVNREPAAYQHLVEQALRAVAGDFRRLGARRFDDALYEEVLAEPARFRGEAFTAKGFFSWAAPQPFTWTVAGGLEAEKTVWQGVFVDERGHPFSFTVTEKPENVQEGQVVRLDGFFFKLLGVFPPGTPDERLDPTVHLVGKRLVRSYLRMEPVERLSPALLGTVRDYELHEQTEIPEEALFHVLSFLQNVDGDALSAAASDVTSAGLMKNPDLYRGTAIKMIGTYAEAWPRHLGDGGENPLELSQIYHALLVHGAPSFTYLLCADRPPAWLKRDENVIVEGIFLKNYLYQTSSGKAQAAPLIVVKRFVQFRVDSSSVHYLLFYVLVGTALLMLVWFLISTFGDRRSEKEFRKRYYERKKALLRGSAPVGSRRGGAGPPA